MGLQLHLSVLHRHTHTHQIISFISCVLLPVLSTVFFLSSRLHSWTAQEGMLWSCWWSCKQNLRKSAICVHSVFQNYSTEKYILETITVVVTCKLWTEIVISWVLMILNDYKMKGPVFIFIKAFQCISFSNWNLVHVNMTWNKNMTRILLCMFMQSVTVYMHIMLHRF